MKRRDFGKIGLLAGAGALTGCTGSNGKEAGRFSADVNFYFEPSKKLPTREFDVVEARHFDDEVFVYGFHDSAPRYQVKDGGTYGIPYRALCVKGIDNLYVSGMMITSDHRAHMSTRNTVSCMGQGQATGTAAALCAQKECSSRDLPFDLLRDRLEKDNVYFEV